MIPFFTLERQNKILKKELDKTISDVIAQGVFILGAKVSELEKAFAKYLGVKYAVGVASGTDALLLSLLAVGVGRGDEVIVPANAYPTAFAIAAAGTVPRLVDIDPRTYNLDPAEIPKAISKKTRAIIVVHLYGQPADMEAVMEIGRKYKIPVVEDCAQAHGAEIKMAVSSKSLKSLKILKWKKVGTIGDLGCFSFYPTKNLGCFGDGGMIVTNNPEIYEKVKLLRMYGEKGRYNSVLLGRNSRLDELQAAILLVKLKYLDKWNERRREIAKLYFAKANNFHIQLPYEVSCGKHVYHLFVVRTKERDELKVYLEKKGIQTAIHYPKPIHFQPSFKFLDYKKGDFPKVEKACGEILSLPMYPELTNREAETVVANIAQFFATA